MKNLVEYIRESLISTLENTTLFEMAYNKNKFMSEVHNLANQIVENYILVRYCSLVEDNYDLRSHWASELLAHCENILSMNIQSSKEKAITQQLITYDELIYPDKVYFIIKRKLSKELKGKNHIQFNEDIIRQAIDDFCYDKQYGIYKLIELMSGSYKNYNELEKFIFEKI